MRGSMKLSPVGVLATEEFCKKEQTPLIKHNLIRVHRKHFFLYR